MTTTYEVTGTITNAGIAAAIQAGSAGPQINVGGFRLGTNSATEGAVAQVTDTDVDGFVYSGDTSSMTYTQVGPDAVVWRVRLDTTVGSFNVGNVGLVLQDGTLFCKAVMPGRQFKWQDNQPGTTGNVIYLNVFMRLANVASLLNLSLLDATDCTLPEVATELLLPPANDTVFDVYMVDNHTHVGVPTTAERLNDQWWHAAHRLYPGQGAGVVVLTQASFATATTDTYQAAPANGPVGYDPISDLFVAADGDDDTIYAVGLRTSPFEITTLGVVPGAAVGIQGTLVPYTAYFAGTGSAVGTLDTNGNGQCVALALSATDVFVDTTGALLGSISGTGEQASAKVEADLLALIANQVRITRQEQRKIRSLEEKMFVLSKAVNNLLNAQNANF